MKYNQYSENLKIINLLNDNIIRIKWNLKSWKNKILLNLILLNMINWLINIYEEIKN